MPDGGNLRATSHPPSPGRAETRPFPGEALPRARVPRAQDPAGVGNQRVSLTARSVSTGDRSGHPHPSPSLILLDLNLCGQHGCDFLKRLRADARFSTIPVVIFTTSDAAADIERCYANGANSYVVKPGTYESLVRCIRDLCGYWVQWNRLPAPHPRGVGDQLARP
jgi:CheY-like chemotaxis protein